MIVEELIEALKEIKDQKARVLIKTNTEEGFFDFNEIRVDHEEEGDLCIIEGGIMD